MTSTATNPLAKVHAILRGCHLGTCPTCGNRALVSPSRGRVYCGNRCDGKGGPAGGPGSYLPGPQWTPEGLPMDGVQHYAHQDGIYRVALTLDTQEADLLTRKKGPSGLPEWSPCRNSLQGPAAKVFEQAEGRAAWLKAKKA